MKKKKKLLLKSHIARKKQMDAQRNVYVHQDGLLNVYVSSTILLFCISEMILFYFILFITF